MSERDDSPVPDVRLQERIAEGGMSHVWRGTLAGTAVPVAVKLATEPAAPETDRDRSFIREVQSEARLSHPGIVDVLDYGHTDASVPGANIELPAGLPYIVMEYAEGGTLAESESIHSWEALRRVLMQLLDALAHAHARGVVHRDIKPQNVLIRSGDAGDFGDGAEADFVLTDFGIAHALATDDVLRTGEVLAVSAGTPSYMAPEQLEERWRDFGPWTDLYSLGCLAYALAAGHPPFVGDRPVDVAKQQLEEPPPRLAPQFPIPGAFRDWLDVLLRKRETSRFQRAADAASALAGLSASPNADDWTGVDSEPIAPSDADTLDGDVLAPTAGGRETSDSPDDGSPPIGATTEPLHEADEPGESAPDRDEDRILTPDHRPEIPRDWRSDRPPSPGHPRGMSLDLFGLREIPVVDRSVQRDRLWGAFLESADASDCEAVLLHGPTGIGKSRLARWLCERAHEVGAATYLKAGRNPGLERSGGLAELLESYFGTWNLGRERTYARIREQLTTLSNATGEDDRRQFVEQDARALTELLWPSGPSTDGPGFDFSSPTERYAVLRRFLERVAARRPLIVWIDDAHDLPRAVDFAADLVERGSGPITVVATVNDDELAGRADPGEAVEAFADRAASIRVGPLDRRDHRRLVDGLLEMDSGLVDQIFERTAGNPLFAFQLIENWIRRGVLRESASGHELATDVHDALPSDVYDACVRRIDLVADRYDGDRRDDAYASLQIAAALGGEVREDTWAEACRLADVEPPPGLVEELVRRGLARHTRRGWRFAHPLLRQTLEQMAREEAVWVGYHDVCADALNEQIGERRGDEARLARHLAEAGRLEEAADALLDAARTHKEAAEFEQALSRLDRHATILDEHDLPDAGRRRAREKLERIGIWKGRGRQRRALDEAESLRPRAEEQGWDDLLVEIYRTLAVGQLYGGDAAEARRWLHSCRELAEATDNARELGYADRYEASVELQEGEPERALELLDRAEDHFRRAGDEARVATVYEKVGYVHMQTDRLERATGRIRKSLDILRNSDVHRPIRIASALNALGDAHRLRGRHGRALEYYREARAIFERADMRSYAATVELNAGLCSMARGSTDQARRALCSARTDFDRAGAEPKRVIAEIGLIACAAQMEDWQRWRDLYEDVEAWLADRDFADRDAAEAAERAGEATVQYGRPEWAERLYRLAAEQWIELGHDDRRDRVRRRLEKLDTTQSA